MKLITDINAANALLQQYRGASFQIHIFGKSLWRLGMELRHPEKPEVLYVVCGITKCVLNKQLITLLVYHLLLGPIR